MFSEFLCDICWLCYAATKNATRARWRMPFLVFSLNHCVFVMLFYIMYLIFLNCPLNALSNAYFSSALRCSYDKLRCVDCDLLCNHSFLEASIFLPTLRVSRIVVHVLKTMYYSFLNCSCNALSNAMFVTNIGHSCKKLYYPKHALFAVLKPSGDYSCCIFVNR